MVGPIEQSNKENKTFAGRRREVEEKMRSSGATRARVIYRHFRHFARESRLLHNEVLFLVVTTGKRK
jgi:hypothetical protein